MMRPRTGITVVSLGLLAALAVTVIRSQFSAGDTPPQQPAQLQAQAPSPAGQAPQPGKRRIYVLPRAKPLTDERYSSKEVATFRAAPPPNNPDFDVLRQYDELPTICDAGSRPEDRAKIEPGKGIPMQNVDCPDVVQARDIGELRVQAAYDRGDYERLDGLWADWCTGEKRFADGTWVLDAFRVALEQQFKLVGDYGESLRRIRDWQVARPGSVAARFAEAVHGRSWAWQARGTGNSREVSKEAWMLFHKRMDAGLESLYNLVQASPACAAPYTLAIDMLTDVGADGEVVRKVYDTAASRFPGSHGLHLAMARNLEPQWGGSVEQYHAFVDEVVERTRPFEGTGMYARLFESVDRGAMAFQPGRAGSPDADRLQASVVELVSRYPTSSRIAAMAANFACRTTDSDSYRRYRAGFVGQELDYWITPSVKACDHQHGWTVQKTAAKSAGK